MGTSDDIFTTHHWYDGQTTRRYSKNARRASLAKMGFNQNFPKASVHSPKERGALSSMVDLTVEQGIRAVEGFLYHKYADNEVAKLMDISLRIAQLESGQEEHLLLHPEIQIPYLTKSWVTDMRNFMEKHNLQIETSNQWSPHTSCQNDEMIMTALIQKGVSKYKQYHINACRVYLQVSTISDISTADGWNGNQA